MKKYNWRVNSFLLGIVILVAACQNPPAEKQSRVDTLPYYDEATFTPRWLSSDDKQLAGFHKIPAFELVNQNGDTITEKSLAGKLFVADFFFTTCPGICPKMTASMVVLQDEFLEDENVFLLSHSVTPTYDSVSVLKEYADEKGVDSRRWFLLTGDRKQIYNLGRKSYFIEEDLGIEKSDDDFLHTENFVLVDKNRHIRGIYNGLNSGSVEQLITDIRTLKAEG